MRREAGLLLVEIDGDELEAHRRLALQAQQHVEQRVGVLAAGQADHDDVAVVDHPVVADGLADEAAQLGLELLEPAGRLSRGGFAFGGVGGLVRASIGGTGCLGKRKRAAMIAVRPRGFDIRASRRPATTARLCEAYHCSHSAVLPNVGALDYVNRSAMKRAVIALVLALAALALLISLALESRSLPVETHVAQYTIAGDLERLNGDFRALVETLESAWRDQTSPGEGARALLERVASQPQQLPAVVVRRCTAAQARKRASATAMRRSPPRSATRRRSPAS